MAAAGVGWTVFPGSPSGAEVGGAVDVEAGLDLEVGLALVDFCAQGGRSGLSWPNATTAMSSAETTRSKVACGRGGVIDIGS